LKHIDLLDPRLFVDATKLKSNQKKLPSTSKKLTASLDGGIPFGTLTEIGAPLGKEGRLLFLTFLSQASKEGMWMLWINGHDQLRIFPPAWFSRGITPENIVFANAQHPTQELQQALLSPLFKVIIIDAPSHTLKKEECAYLCHCARNNKQAIIVLRDFFLTPRLGNTWATLRLNLSKNHFQNRYRIQVVRGLPQHASWLEEKDIQ
jgi:hypothetical protein